MIDAYLSYSQIKVWLSCRRAWEYQYLSKYRAKQPALDFMRGSLLHLGMQYGLYEALGWEFGTPELPMSAFDVAIQEWMKEWSKTGDMIVSPTWFGENKMIVDGALRTFQEEWEVVLDAKEQPLIERAFFVDMPGWKGLIFIPDAIVRRKIDPFKGGIHCLDFKSFSKPKPDAYGEYDLQAAIYQTGLQTKGIPCVGTVLFELNTEPPKTPRVNADGTQHKGDVAHAANWRSVRGQIKTYRHDDYLAGIWNQIVLPAAAEIAYFKEFAAGDALVPAMDYYKCGFCEFRGPCQARLRNDDEAAILQEQFNRRTR